jgi:hypothetical protein
MMTLLRIRGNALGFAMIVASALVAGVGGFVLHLADAPVMIGVGISLILMDLFIRLRSRPAPGWLTQSQWGGYLFFVPVWVVGIVMIVVNIVNLFVNSSGS